MGKGGAEGSLIQLGVDQQPVDHPRPVPTETTNSDVAWHSLLLVGYLVNEARRTLRIRPNHSQL